jgi:hypothetical protein
MITNSPANRKEPVPPLVKVRDVATLLSVSRHTVHHLIDSGDLEASEINSSKKQRRHLTRALANPFEP